MIPASGLLDVSQRAIPFDVKIKIRPYPWISRPKTLAWPASSHRLQSRQAHSQRGENAPMKLALVLLNNTSGLLIADRQPCSEASSRCDNQVSHCNHSWLIIVRFVPGSVIV
jgi:hypothetical protein